MGIFKNRMPSRAEILAVFGAVIFFVHSWSVRAFLYKLPSFMFYFSLGEILSVFAYMMAVALLESTLVTAGLVFLSLILPVKWFRQGFIYKGFLTLSVVAVAMVRLQTTMKNTFPGWDILLKGTEITVLILIVILLISHFFKPLQKAAEFVVDRVSVLAYIYVPVGLLSLLVVIFRNIF